MTDEQLEQEPVEIYAEIRPEGHWSWWVEVFEVMEMPGRPGQPSNRRWPHQVRSGLVLGRMRAERKARRWAQKRRAWRARRAAESRRVDL